MFWTTYLGFAAFASACATIATHKCYRQSGTQTRRIIFGLVIFSIVYFSPIAWQFTIGAVQGVRAYQGDAKAMYELARWHESHSGKITVLIPYWNKPNIDDGFKWLHRSASKQFPPAMYCLGVRLKYRILVPIDSIDTNEGQSCIDKANRMGFKSVCLEDEFYWQCYRYD